MGPEATLPASKAIPVNTFGTTKLNINATVYPGTIKCHNSNPGTSIRKTDPTTASPTPSDKDGRIKLRLIAPPVTSSICLTNTLTAGSARMVTTPKTKENTNNTNTFPCSASCVPKAVPTSIKPALTPVKKRIKPVNVYKSPKMSRRFFC